MFVLGIAGAALAAPQIAIGADPAAAATAYTVTTTADTFDANVGDGICRTAVGTCSLRAALQEARVDGVPTTIGFAIPGPLPHTIQLASNLPRVEENATVIDGYSQPGSAPNTDPLGSNAVIGVQIRGTGSTGPHGIVISSDDNVVRGLAIFNAATKVRLLESANRNRVVGNFIGTNAAGTAEAGAFASVGMGVSINDASNANVIGAPALADRNVISGNAGRGVSLFFDSDNNTVQNNIIGLSPTGAPLSNWGHGVDVNFGSSGNLVGGTEPGTRNVVSANRAHGLEISHQLTTTGNRYVGNFVGTSLDGNGGTSSTTGNFNFGIHVEDRVNANTISYNVVAHNRRGGITVQRIAFDNTIRYNRVGITPSGAAPGNGPSGWGIRLALGASGNTIGPDNIVSGNGAGIQVVDADTVNNRITRNSTFANRGLGIDLPSLGAVNPNDLDDLDSGPQTLLNWPVLTVRSPTRVDAQTCGGCTVELFVADAGTAAYGEGRTYLASAVANASGLAVVNVAPIAQNRVVTATAIDATGDTSEFSRNVNLPAG